MELINYEGLNCYSNSIVSIAHDFGLNYLNAYAALWSETDFYYQLDRRIFLSKRLPEALEKLGIALVMQLCGSPEQAKELLSQLKEGELIVLGMDAYYVPWSPCCGVFHGPHFFAARYTGGEALPCYDPTFGNADVQLSVSEIIAHAYDISRMRPVERAPEKIAPLADVREMLDIRAALRPTLIEPLEDLTASGRGDASLLAKYTDALISNRCLYHHYLKQLPPPYDKAHLLMNDGFFSRWTAVKNGLNMAVIKKDNRAIIAEVRAKLSSLIDEEISMAAQMLDIDAPA